MTDKMVVDSEVDFDVHVYRLKEAEGQHSTLIHTENVSDNAASIPGETFNLLMADVSSSMAHAWTSVFEGWNNYIKNKLAGLTKLFVFSNSVTFLRCDTYLDKTDFVGGGTNITEALERVRHEIANCKEKIVQVFIITDGHHNANTPDPEEEINQMKVPSGKTVNVYLLGLTMNFPVNYSIDIRSRLHNGSANMPSLYWAKTTSDITDQMINIGENMNFCSVKMKSNHKGYILPGLDVTSTLYFNEWMYFPRPPETFTDLKITLDSKERKITENIKDADISILVDYVFPQWNTVLIQRHRQKLHVPKETFNLMDSLFQVHISKLNSFAFGNDIKGRLEKKFLRSYEIKFRTLMNMSRSVIEIEGRYEDEMELANIILKSTVSGRKYDVKNLKMRGHGLDDFDQDVIRFKAIYENIKPAIMLLPAPEPEDCCRITISSTLSDLQDEDFLLILNDGKYDLLRTFTMTGIPAYAPVKDASQINVWTLTISHMLVAPFTILSQRAIEEKVRVAGSDDVLGFIDKDVVIKPDDEKSRFNIIIPILPASVSTVLKPIVRSNLYAMMATFCILKNPHIVDYSAHIAALACAWVRSIADHPPSNRPVYVTERLATITATAELYMDRKSIVTYLECISTEPQQALMTESTKTYDEHTLKCESLVKPLFFLTMRKDKLTVLQLQALLPLMLTEFIGRCLSNYKIYENNATPFTDFFAMDLNDPERKKKWLLKASQDFVKEFKTNHQNLLEDFYASENLQKTVTKFIEGKKLEIDHITGTTDVKISMDKVKNLRNVTNCGDVRFYTFRAWAQEMGVPEDAISAAYDPSQVLVYVYHALKFRSSRDRQSRKLSSYDECMKEIKMSLSKENGRALFLSIKEKVSDVIMSQWRKEYFSTHKPVVIPLTPEEVVAQARARNIEVTQETFSKVYKYDPKCKLIRNACQIPACPFYLIPTKRFNQHLAVERIPGEFPHSLHLISKEKHDEDADEVIKEIITRSQTGYQGRKKYPISKPLYLQNMMTEIQELLHSYNQNETT